MKDNLQDFINEVHNNEELRKEVQLAGKSVSNVENRQLKRDTATELAKVASRYGYTLHVDDFYPNSDSSWLSPIIE